MYCQSTHLMSLKIYWKSFFEQRITKTEECQTSFLSFCVLDIQSYKIYKHKEEDDEEEIVDEKKEVETRILKIQKDRNEEGKNL